MSPYIHLGTHFLNFGIYPVLILGIAIHTFFISVPIFFPSSLLVIPITLLFSFWESLCYSLSLFLLFKVFNAAYFIIVLMWMSGSGKLHYAIDRIRVKSEYHENWYPNKKSVSIYPNENCVATQIEKSVCTQMRTGYPNIRIVTIFNERWCA